MLSRLAIFTNSFSALPEISFPSMIFAVLIGIVLAYVLFKRNILYGNRAGYQLLLPIAFGFITPVITVLAFNTFMLFSLSAAARIVYVVLLALLLSCLVIWALEIRARLAGKHFIKALSRFGPKVEPDRK